MRLLVSFRFVIFCSLSWAFKGGLNFAFYWRLITSFSLILLYSPLKSNSSFFNINLEIQLIIFRKECLQLISHLFFLFIRIDQMADIDAVLSNIKILVPFVLNEPKRKLLFAKLIETRHVEVELA
jgi:hypothetical protein